MITIFKGQKMIDYDDLEAMESKVYENDTDLVAFCQISEPDVKFMEFQADFAFSRLRV